MSYPGPDELRGHTALMVDACNAYLHAGTSIVVTLGPLAYMYYQLPGSTLCAF